MVGSVGHVSYHVMHHQNTKMSSCHTLDNICWQPWNFNRTFAMYVVNEVRGGGGASLIISSWIEKLQKQYSRRDISKLIKKFKMENLSKDFAVGFSQ